MDRRGALVLSPGSVNYFYDVTGRRFAEALSDLGYAVTIHSLRGYSDDIRSSKRTYDVGILVNVPEIAFAMGDQSEATVAFAAVRKRCRQLFAIGMDCVTTPWFSNLFRKSLEVGVDGIVDLGFVDQGESISHSERQSYHFMLAGLTRTEKAQIEMIATVPEDRPIPWLFVGHYTPHRQALADRLAAELDPEGFVYLPPLEPYRAVGPHLNEEDLNQLLQRSRLQIWCSHHDSFYMESERLRMSLLAGNVPVKVVTQQRDTQRTPFRSNLFEEDRLVTQLRSLDEREAFERFRNEYLGLPSLTDELARLLTGRKRSERRTFGARLRQLGRTLLPLHSKLVGSRRQVTSEVER